MAIILDHLEENQALKMAKNIVQFWKSCPLLPFFCK